MCIQGYAREPLEADRRAGRAVGGGAGAQQGDHHRGEAAQLAHAHPVSAERP